MALAGYVLCPRVIKETLFTHKSGQMLLDPTKTNTPMQTFEWNIFLFSQIFWLALCQTEWITVNEAIFGKRSRAAAFVDPVTAPLTPNQTIQTRDGHDIVEPSFDNVCMCVCWVNIISCFEAKNGQASFQHV